MSHVARAVALAGALLAPVAGCGDDAPGPGAPLHADASDARYVLAVRAEAPSVAGTSGALHFRVEPRRGWHLALEAPTWLELREPAAGRLEPAFQPDAETDPPDAVEFRTPYPAEAARVEGRIEGRLKFGVCQDGDPQCAIVRRDLSLPLPPPR